MLTPSLAAELAVTWRDIQAGTPLFVVRKDCEYLCEGPRERMDMLPEDVNDETESAIRIFAELQDARKYCDQWRHMLGDEPANEEVHLLNVVTVTLSKVWSHLGAIVTNSYIEYQTPPRIELCRLNHVGTPVVLDTLFSEQAEMN